MVTIERLRRMRWQTVLPLTLLATCSTSPRTEVIVVVDSDFDVPSELDQLSIDVESPSGTMRNASAMLGGNNPGLPRTLGLVPEGDDLGPYEVTATGLLSGTEVVSRSASFEFVDEHTLVLIMHLVAACEGVSCSSDESCGEDGCEARVRSALPAWTGRPPRIGETPEFDAGLEDSGPGDAGLDGAAPDTSMPDTSMPDTSMPDTSMPIDADLDATMPDTSVDVGVDTSVDTCVAADETCNGMDDDCDEMIDEDLSGVTELCNGVDDDCDMMTDETFDLMMDSANCGMCGRVCNFRNGTGACMNGNCVIASCDTNFDDCDTDGTNGCETNIQMSNDHCSSCGIACEVPNRFCCSGTCQRQPC